MHRLYRIARCLGLGLKCGYDDTPWWVFAALVLANAAVYWLLPASG